MAMENATRLVVWLLMFFSESFDWHSRSGADICNIDEARKLKGMK